MTFSIAPALPERRLMTWLVIGVAATFAFSIGGAAGLGFDGAAIENGPQENVEIALLLAAALTFGIGAVWGRGPAAPVLMILGLIFGLMGLREFETPIDNGLLAYLAGHSARYHWAALTLVATALVALRDRRWTWREHMRASGPVWAPLVAAAIIVVLGAFAEEAASAAPPETHARDLMEWLEESFEVCAYAVAFVTALWMWRLRPHGGPAAS